MQKKVIITGASGMVGGMALKKCLENESVAKVTILVRKPLGIEHPKLKEIIHTDYNNYDLVQNDLAEQDTALFCIGVYSGAVPREQFREITVDYPINFAQVLKAKSPKATFCLLSGAGANAKSRVMFAKDKGEAENQLTALGLGSFYSLRPGYIYPVEPREEPNFSYKLMRWLYKPLIRPLGKKMSITSEQLAEGMMQVGLGGAEKTILENRDILERIELKN